ncbi:response regulator [Mucilaginibacter conchicola]|uniref:Response regulator n=1 Tax=Mucilaginibacter conchicola TaxID=2303333 RepID=A0A372NMS3_9SPHI|nr:response regulator [Mucilaginibacter conchicola]RFZ90236.1 response regulator [Mucilaginibacter conchicola]
MKKKILVIEDDADVLEITSAVLKAAEFEVVRSEGTNNVIDLVERHHPDLVLTDYMLPGLSGGQICTLIKQNKGTSKLPVILMSAYKKEAIALGNFSFDAYVKKPFDINYLVSVIRRYIN